MTDYNSSDVVTGNQATATQYNNLRADVIIGTATAGDILQQDANGPFVETGDAYAKKAEIRVTRSGTYRIKFDLKAPSGVGYDAYGKIYRNGGAVGTERTTDSTSYVQFSEDISGWTENDLLQLYLHKSGAGSNATAQDLELYCAEIASRWEWLYENLYATA